MLKAQRMMPDLARLCGRRSARARSEAGGV